MEKAEARKIIKGLQALVFNRGDGAVKRGDAEKILSDVAAYAEKHKPKTTRTRRGSRDRQERGGHDREEQ